jgi:hypothetical protein
MRACENCGGGFHSFNPLRKLCDSCRREQDGNASVLLGTAENELEANVWRDVLAREGIGSALRQTDPVAARWQSLPMPFSVEVLVLQKDLERGRELLDLD